MRPIAILWMASINAAAAALALTIAPKQYTLEQRYLAGLTAPEPDAGNSDEIAQTIRKYALNALLVPVLDGDGYPARWQDASLAMVCDAGTRVWVDGRPLEPRGEVPGASFSLQRLMVGCAPFGRGGHELSGHAETLVLRDDDGLSAIARFIDLKVTGPPSATSADPTGRFAKSRSGRT
jgi:hypothetical protein